MAKRLGGGRRSGHAIGHMQRRRLRARPEHLLGRFCERARLGIAVGGLADGFAVDPQRDVVAELPAIHFCNVDRPLESVGECVERTGEVVPVYAQVEGKWLRVSAGTHTNRSPCAAATAAPTASDRHRPPSPARRRRWPRPHRPVPPGSGPGGRRLLDALFARSLGEPGPPGRAITGPGVGQEHRPLRRVCGVPAITGQLPRGPIQDGRRRQLRATADAGRRRTGSPRPGLPVRGPCRRVMVNAAVWFWLMQPHGFLLGDDDMDTRHPRGRSRRPRGVRRTRPAAQCPLSCRGSGRGLLCVYPAQRLSSLAQFDAEREPLRRGPRRHLPVAADRSLQLLGAIPARTDHWGARGKGSRRGRLRRRDHRCPRTTWRMPASLPGRWWAAGACRWRSGRSRCSLRPARSRRSDWTASPRPPGSWSIPKLARPSRNATTRHWPPCAAAGAGWTGSRTRFWSGKRWRRKRPTLPLAPTGRPPQSRSRMASRPAPRHPGCARLASAAVRRLTRAARRQGGRESGRVPPRGSRRGRCCVPAAATR